MTGYQDSSEFEHGVIAGAREMGQTISEVAMKFRFSRTTISRVNREYRESGKISNLRHRCGRKKDHVRDALGHDKLCSAFQIRYGGYKGMLVVDPTLKGIDIVFRESMKKFDSPENIRLEIARTSAPGRETHNILFYALLALAKHPFYVNVGTFKEKV
ncbi:RNA-dependent RNA polymerase [Trichonephila clavipes]|nr:RNA-dependent RNA polymerase [Trichonephila clavipes]